jgi:hypothetical protein
MKHLRALTKEKPVRQPETKHSALTRLMNHCSLTILATALRGEFEEAIPIGTLKQFSDIVAPSPQIARAPNTDHPVLAITISPKEKEGAWPQARERFPSGLVVVENLSGWMGKKSVY